MRNFKIGDRVRCIKEYGSNKHIMGKKGTVIGEDENVIDVEFDEDINGHTCGGKGQNGCCWHILNNGQYLEFISNVHKKIVITTDGKNTKARLYEEKSLMKEAIATCNPDDEFDFETGAEIAFNRLLGKEDEIKIGDIVKITDKAERYPVYIDWVKANAFEYLGKFAYKGAISNGVYGRVVAIAPHSDRLTDLMLYLIQMPEGECHLITREGFEKERIS